MTLAIDSTPITVQQVGVITAWTAPGAPAPQTGFGDCPAYDVGPSGFIEVPVTVQDTNGFLCEYELEAQFGHGNSPVVTPPGVRGYKSNPTPGFPPDFAAASWQGGTETMTFPGTTVQGSPGRLLLRIPALLRQAGNQRLLLAYVQPGRGRLPDHQPQVLELRGGGPAARDRRRAGIVMNPAEFCVASLATWRLAHLLHVEDGPWHCVARLRQALNARQLGVLECFFCASVWTALPAAMLVSTRRRQFLSPGRRCRRPRLLIERAAFPGTFLDVPEFSEDEEIAHVLRPD